VQDRLGDNQEQTTVTHPDGSTEAVADSQTQSAQSTDPDANGGSHRA
jgi:hypothetical protein